MVRNETQEGWDWRTALRAQLEERNVLYELVKGLSDGGKVTFTPAWHAIGTY